MFDATIVSEDDLLPISALQHLAFCERQCALIHLEGMWQENRLTAEGRGLHDRAHDAEVEVRPGVRIVRGLRLRSIQLGLTGQADVVEFQSAAEASDSVKLPGVQGWWRPYPVEYKRGRPKTNRCDEIQLCAQAMCLEEMLQVSIAEGALYYGTRRRRTGVTFGLGLREETGRMAARLREMMASGRTPAAVLEPKCRQCSLIEICMPGATDGSRRVAQYLRRATETALMEPEA
jgi:CRISPR-associated exonuclease Cas4